MFERTIMIGFVLSLTLPWPALAKDKSEKYYELAQQAEDRNEHEKALELYTMALEKQPANPVYQMAVRRESFKTSQVHVETGEKLRKNGMLEAALGEFRKAFAQDPSNALALDEIKRVSASIERIRRGEIASAAGGTTPEEEVERRKLERLSAIGPPPVLKPASNHIATLKMNNQPPKVLYETVSKLAGINLIFDPQMQGPLKNANLELIDTTIPEALDHLAILTKTYWKPITSNTIFVTDDSVTKRRDYEDQVLRVFYLHNMTSVQDFQEVVTAVRAALDLRRMYTFNSGNAVVARGTADQIALAEKLFHDLDRPKAEVVVDIIVMEAKTNRTREIAMSLVSNGAPGLSIPAGFAPRSSIATPSSSSSSSSSSNSNATATSIGAGNIGKVGFNDFSITLPGALLQAVMSDNSTRIMQSPQVRVSDGQKVSLKIGDRVPYASGSYQAGVTGATLSPLVSTQFNFIETGVILELTPHVHHAGELTLHVAIDISAVSQQVNIGGLEEPEVTQHKEETDIRVRDGEVNLLGGLTQLQETKTLAGIPGLVRIPVLGRLLGDNSIDKSRGELMIALVPHIVRMPEVTPLDIQEVATGPEQAPKVNWDRNRGGPAPDVTKK